MLRPEFLALFVASILARLLCLVIVLGRGLGRRYWTLTVFLTAGSIRSSILLWYSFQGLKAYAHAWTIAEKFNFALDALLAFGAIDLIARHYRNAYPFTTILTATLGALSAALVWLSAAQGVHLWPSVSAAVLLWKRHNAAFWLFVVLAAGAWFSAPGVPVRRNARAHLLVTAGYFAAALAYGAVHSAAAGITSWVQTAAWINGLSPLIYYGAWIHFLRRDGEQLPAPARPTGDVALGPYVAKARAAFYDR